MADEDDRLKFVTRLGPKSQLVIGHSLRERLGLKPGSLVRETVAGNKIIVEAFDWEKEIKEVEKIAKMVGKKWPKGKTSVDLIREERD